MRQPGSRLFKRTLLAAAAIGCLVVIRILAGNSDSAFRGHFGFSMPERAELLHYQYDCAGFSDCDHLFVFRTEDDELRDRLISSWRLKPGEALGGAMKWRSTVEWWPSEEQLQGLKDRHGRDDLPAEKYYFIWVDHEKSLVYVNYGNW